MAARKAEQAAQDVPASKLELTPSQVTIARKYADDEFAYVLGCPTLEAFRGGLDQCGDTLFKFLMIETSKGEDCLSHVATMKRLELALGDLAKVLDAVDVEAD